MKIVYCLPGLFNSAGMERVITNKANYLARRGYEVVIITTEQKGRSVFFSLHPAIRTLDLGINYSDDANKNIFSKTICFLKKRRWHQRSLTKYLLSESPDITISTFGTEATFLHKIQDKSKKVIEIHFSKYFRLQYDRKGLWRWVDKLRSWQDERLISCYDKFVVLTNEDKGYWGNYSNIIVIPNFITSVPLRQSNVENKICLAVGRLTYQKGFDLLIKAWSIVKARFPDWQLQIYGSGELYADLNHLVNELHMNEVVKINGATNKIDQIYLNASMLSISSRYEGFSMVLLEAHSYGLPVVSFTCKCGPRDLIKDGVDGFLVPDNDVKSLATKMMLLMENESMRKQMGQAAHQSSLEYTEEKIMAKWIHLFESLK